MRFTRIFSKLVPLTILALCMAQTIQAHAATITIGQTTVFTTGDNGNANLLCAQKAALSQSATINSLSFYVATASGQLRMGIYDATGPNGGPGALKAQTNAFTPTTGWNTQNVVTPVVLAAGNYWLVYLPSSNTLAFRKSSISGGSCKYYSYTFGSMPSTYSTSPSDCSPYNWSFYATLTPTGGGTPTISLSPTSLSFSATAGGGNPSSQNVTVSNSGGGTLASPTTQINYSQGSGWLTVTTQGSSAPFTLVNQPTTGSLAAGTYNATVQVSSSGASNTPQSYTVSFVVSSGGSQCIVTAALGTCGPYSDAALSTTFNTITQNDVWNPPSQWSQTLTTTNPSNWNVVANFPTDSSGAIHSYPSAAINYYNGTAPTLDSYSYMYSSFATTPDTSSTTVGDYGFDIWMNNWAQEIMIQHQLVNTPACTTWMTVLATNVSFGGSYGVPVQTWNLCRNGGAGSEIVWQITGASGSKNFGVSTSSVDIYAMLKYLENHGYLATGSTFTQTCEGFEISTTGGLSKTFTLSNWTQTASH